MIRHPAWPHPKTSTGGWRALTERRSGRVVDTLTVRAIEDFYGIYNLEEWLLRAYYLRHATYAELAAELGVSAGTIAKWMKDMGCTYRLVAFHVMEQQLAEREPAGAVSAEAQEAG